MRVPTRSRFPLFILALLVLYILSVLINLGTLEFSAEEPRRAMISVEMLETGNFISPQQYGWNYYNKPPLFNWILAAVIWLTGSVSEFVLRLPSFLAYLLMGFVHYRVSRNFFPKRTAVISSFFVLTCADVYTYGLAYGGEIDIFYSLVVYLQAISIFWFYNRQQYLLLYLVSYLFCAIGFLTKAFPSLLFQGFTLAALCFYAKSLKPFFRWQHLLGLFVFLLVTGTYFYAYSFYNSPSRFLINLFNEAILKSAVGEKSAKLVDKAIIYPWLFVKMFLPWSLLLLLLFKRGSNGFRENPLVWFSVLFIVFNIGVYWFTGQPKIRYVYMFIPFGCTILIHLYQRFSESSPQMLNKILTCLGFVFLLPLLVVIGFPFFKQVNIGWIISLALAFLALLYGYYHFAKHRIWWFLAGFILLRLVYAVLFIPLQREGIESYQEHMQQLAGKTNHQAVQYWAEAMDFPVAINTSFFSYQAETIKMPATLPLELPYYYYRNTGHIIRFDTIPKLASYFVAFESQLGQKKIDTLYAYFDRNLGKRIVFYQLKQ